MKSLFKNPAFLLRVDAVGAALSAVFLGLVLPQFPAHIGMPTQTLYLLAALPVVFALYDVWCLTRSTPRFGRALRGISIANATYAMLSVGFLWVHASQLEPLGWAYFIGELGIVLALAGQEWRLAKHY